MRRPHAPPHVGCTSRHHVLHAPHCLLAHVGCTAQVLDAADMSGNASTSRHPSCSSVVHVFFFLKIFRCVLGIYLILHTDRQTDRPEAHARTNNSSTTTSMTHKTHKKHQTHTDLLKAAGEPFLVGLLMPLPSHQQEAVGRICHVSKGSLFQFERA
jgi:hypothetical protein